MKSFALSVAFIMRFTATRKWPLLTFPYILPNVIKVAEVKTFVILGLCVCGGGDYFSGTI